MSAQKLEWKVDEEGLVVFPNDLGDLEIRSINMSYERCELKLCGIIGSDPEDEESHYIVSLGYVSYLSFVSDHLQNVVDSAHIFRRDEIDKARNFRDFYGKSQFPADCKVEANFYLFISPITGGDLFVATDKIEFLHCPSQHPEL